MTGTEWISGVYSSQVFKNYFPSRKNYFPKKIIFPVLRLKHNNLTLNPDTEKTSGFASSAIFGTFLGIYVDKYGRRWGCIVFCVLEIIINLLEHVNNFPLLLLGRVMGGLTTSLLFSAFESWMVTEHRRRGFPEELLSTTFSLGAAGNGVMAIGAGLAAQVAADVKKILFVRRDGHILDLKLGLGLK